MPKPTTELPDNQVIPNPQHEKRTYRYFSVADKKRILAEAGRKLFNVSRTQKSSSNDSHRLIQYLKRYGLSFKDI